MSRSPLLPFVGALIVVGTIIFKSPEAVSGPGHDHGHAAVTQKSTPASPRITAVSEDYELVGILKDGQLTMYLDDLRDTSPVTNATLELEVDGVAGIAEPTVDGTYLYKDPVLSKHGTKEIIITLRHGGKSDLLLGTLGDHHSHDHEGVDAAHSQTAHQRGTSETGNEDRNDSFVTRLLNPLVVGGIALSIGLLLGVRLRQRTTTTAVLSFLILMIGAGFAWAGPGHDHEHGHSHGGSAGANNGDAPHRLSDGTLFLPKPTQRLLEIRTKILKPSTARSTQTLIGRVIADPNQSGLVQSTIGGRIQVPPSGLPILGQSVQAGDVLAYVEPAFEPIDASDVGQTAGDLEQRMAVLEARIARQERLVKKGVVNKASLEDLKIELKGLRARRVQLDKSRREPETLIAPVDGVIAEVHVVAGQVITSANTLFHIVNPASFFVEAITFDPQITQKAATAHAQTPDGEELPLKFVGRSRALQQQATVLHFRISSPPSTLSIGTPIKVLVDTGQPVNGLIVPREAIAQAPNGQTVVFKRLAPEKYKPAPIRIETIDGKRVRVTAGLSEGEQIIVRNAPLVNQIR